MDANHKLRIEAALDRVHASCRDLAGELLSGSNYKQYVNVLATFLFTEVKYRADLFLHNLQQEGK